MSDQLELDGTPEKAELELDAPAATSPTALLAKAGALTGALVQRGREKAPRLIEAGMPMERMPPAPFVHPLGEGAPEFPPAPPTPELSRWTDVIFAAACCVAFFATFLFVLHF